VSDEATALRLIGYVYSAAEDPSLWTDFVREYAQAINASTSVLFMQQVSAPVVTINAALDFHGAEAYERYYASVNPLILLNQERIIEGDVATSQRTISDADFERTEFYSDFLEPHDLHHEIGCVLLKRDDVAAYLTALRPKRFGAFADEESSLLHHLLPHIQRSLRLHQVWRSLSQQAEALRAAVERADLAVLVLDRRGEIVEANTRARVLMRERTFLGNSRYLEPADPAARAAMRRAIASASSVFNRVGPPAADVRIPRERGAALTATVTPIAGGESAFPASGAMVVTINDPDAKKRDRLSVGRERFRLTQAEARLVERLLTGTTLKEAALENDISIHTAREYLKRIFAKTGARSQADLVRLLMQ
jgi:DNA-binding CsgD family transcriptional regulator/PAS domain-containing protein